MVGGEDDDRVVDLPVFSQRIEDAADVVVETLHHAVITWHQHPHGVGGDSWARRSPARCLCARFVHRDRDRHFHVFVHLVVRLADGVRAVRIREADHVTKRLGLVEVDEVDRAVGQPVCGERFAVGVFDAVRRFTPLDGCDARAGPGYLEFLPVAAVEHVAVVVKAELPLGRPLRFAQAVEMPLACVTGLIAFPAKHLGESHDVVTKRDVVVGDLCVLRIAPAD